MKTIRYCGLPSIYYQRGRDYTTLDYPDGNYIYIVETDTWDRSDNFREENEK